MVADAIREVWRGLRSWAAQSWATTDGRVESTAENLVGFGEWQRYVAEVNYSYKVEGEFYSGVHEVNHRAEFAAFPKESRVVVHYKPSNPALSVLDSEDLRSRRERMLAEMGFESGGWRDD